MIKDVIARRAIGYGALLTRRTPPEARHVKRLAREAVARQWNKEAIEKFAVARLQTVLKAAADVRYYRQDRYRSALREALAGPASLSALELFPILSRSDFRKRFRDAVRNAPGSVVVATTSGTGGATTPVVKPRSSLTHRGALERRWYESVALPSFFTIAGVTPWSGRGLIRNQFHDWRVRFYDIGASDVVEMFRSGRSVGALLLGAPEFLLFVLDRADPVGLSAVASSYELLRSDVRADLEKRGLPLLELYCASEISVPIAFRFPECQGMHVNADYVHVEIFSGGAKLGHGHAGAVVVSDLLNTAMPLVRYEIGDIGALDPPESCPCGRALPLITLYGRPLSTVSAVGRTIDASVVVAELTAHLRRPVILDQVASNAFEIFCEGEVDLAEAQIALERLVGPCLLKRRQPDRRLRSLLTDQGFALQSAPRYSLAEYLEGAAPSGHWRPHPADAATVALNSP